MSQKFKKKRDKELAPDVTTNNKSSVERDVL